MKKFSLLSWTGDEKLNEIYLADEKMFNLNKVFIVAYSQDMKRFSDMNFQIDSEVITPLLKIYFDLLRALIFI